MIAVTNRSLKDASMECTALNIALVASYGRRDYGFLINGFQNFWAAEERVSLRAHGFSFRYEWYQIKFGWEEA